MPCVFLCVVAEFKANTMAPIDIQSPRLFLMIHWSVQYKWWFSEFYRGVVCRNCEKGSQLVIVINEINLVMKVVDSRHLLDQRMIEGEIILFPQLVRSCFISFNEENLLRKILTVFMFSKPFRRYRKIGENQSWNEMQITFLCSINPFISRMDLRISICLELHHLQSIVIEIDQSNNLIQGIYLEYTCAIDLNCEEKSIFLRIVVTSHTIYCQPYHYQVTPPVLQFSLELELRWTTLSSRCSLKITWLRPR